MKRSTWTAHLAAVFIVSLLMLLIYSTVQQNYRMSANDPQISLANEIRYRLNTGQSIGFLFPEDTIDISGSLGVFVAFYDAEGHPLHSSGKLNRELPELPAGVFREARSRGEDRITWQPRPGVRIALVIDRVENPEIAYVAVGRSLREVEIREGNLAGIVLLSWIAAMAVIIANWLLNLKITMAGDREFFFLLKYAAIAGNVLFILWIIYNAVDEGFKATWPERLSATTLIGLLVVNSMLLLKMRPRKGISAV